ncbi:hypothetical protein MPER_08886, partial [Moniliophthora perniciosa FA553]
TYGYNKETIQSTKLALESFKLEHLDGNRRALSGEIQFYGGKRAIKGEGNGPLSALLAALHANINGTLTIREYSEHSIGEGSEVGAASFVELVYEVLEQKKRTAWGVAADTDITASGIKAVLSAASRLDVVVKGRQINGA